MTASGDALGALTLERAIESAGWLRIENDLPLRSRVLRLALACMLERSSVFYECVIDGLTSEMHGYQAFGDLLEALWQSDGAVASTLQAEEFAGVCSLPVDASPPFVRIVWRLEQFVTRECGIPELISRLGVDISDIGLGPLTRSWIRNRQGLSFADAEIRHLNDTSEIWPMLSVWLVADMHEAASALSPVDVQRLRQRARNEAGSDLVRWWDTMRSVELPPAAEVPEQVLWADLLSGQ